MPSKTIRSGGLKHLARAMGAGKRASVTPQRGLNPKKVTAPPTLNTSTQAGLGSGTLAFGMLTGGAIGGVTGATISNKDKTTHGAITGGLKGAFAGAIVGGMTGAGIPALAKQGATNNKFMRSMGSYSSSVTQLANHLHSAGARSGLFASGGLLGGVVFGGNESRRRGFNQNRGARINSSGY